MNKKKYILDTNILIGFQLWNPYSINKIFWDLLEEKIKEERVVILDVVVDEVKYPDFLKKWCKNLKTKKLIQRIENIDKFRAFEINEQYLMINKETNKSKVDTYIIAYAERKGLLICSRERNKNKTEHIYKIPDVCKILKIPITRNPEEFLHNIDFNTQ